MDYLLPAVESVMSQGNVAAKDIDLIVSFSVSPDHLARDSSIGGPRTGHPLQKEISARNAFVFDLMDTSLAKVLHIVNTLSWQEGHKRILLVRSEISHCVKQDSQSGFFMQDGAMALLVAPMEQQYFQQSYLGKTFHPLVMELNTDIRTPQDHKCMMRFPTSEKLCEAMETAFEKLLTPYKKNNIEGIMEQWFHDTTDNKPYHGPFHLAQEFMVRLKQCQHGQIAAASFDPFGPAIDMVTAVISPDYTNA